jgi:uncharacterized protein (TIRG00374 family)
LKNNILNFLKLVISLSLSGIIIYFAVKDLSVDQINQIKNSILSADYKWILGAMLLSAIACYVRALRWKLLLHPTGFNPRTSVTAYSVFIMYIGNLVFPRLGEISRCAILNYWEKVPLDKSIGTMITERIIDMVGVLFLCSFAFIFELDIILAFIDKYKTNIPSGLSVSAFIKYGAAFILAIGLLYFVGTKFKLFDKIKEIAGGLISGLKSVFELERPFLFLFYSAIIYVFWWLALVLCFKAMPETAHLHATAGLTCLFVSSLGVMITPGGLGAYQSLMQLTLLLYGIDSVIGLAFGWITWSCQTSSLLIGGIICLMLLFLTKKKDYVETTH